MKKTVLIGLLILIMSVSACASEKDEWVRLVNSDGTIAVSYLDRSDTLSYIPEEDDMINIYRRDQFTLTVSVRGYAADLDTVGKNLQRSYSTDEIEVADTYTEDSVSGFPCRRLRLTGKSLSNGAIMFFTDPETGYYYEIFWTVSSEANSDTEEHVKALLDRLVLGGKPEKQS